MFSDSESANLAGRGPYGVCVSGSRITGTSLCSPVVAYIPSPPQDIAWMLADMCVFSHPSDSVRNDLKQCHTIHRV